MVEWYAGLICEGAANEPPAAAARVSPIVSQYAVYGGRSSVAQALSWRHSGNSPSFLPRSCPLPWPFSTTSSYFSLLPSPFPRLLFSSHLLLLLHLLLITQLFLYKHTIARSHIHHLHPACCVPCGQNIRTPLQLFQGKLHTPYRLFAILPPTTSYLKLAPSPIETFYTDTPMDDKPIPSIDAMATRQSIVALWRGNGTKKEKRDIAIL